jgi:hypothetical protein
MDAAELVCKWLKCTTKTTFRTLLTSLQSLKLLSGITCLKVRFSLSTVLPLIYTVTPALYMRAAYGIINDVYVNGQGQDVLCRSNQIINDPTMYQPGSIFNNLVSESCLYFDLLLKYYSVLNDLACDVYKYAGNINTADFCVCSD